LRSRFPIILEFDDYSTAELLAIADVMLRKRSTNSRLKRKEKLARILFERYQFEPQNFGNARLVRNHIERAHAGKQAVRLVNEKRLSREQLMLILPQDIMEDEE